jgi:hypothetical protein
MRHSSLCPGADILGYTGIATAWLWPGGWREVAVI